MELDLIFKIAAVGIIVAVLNQILKKTDHDEQAMMLTVAGLVIVLMMIMPAIDELFGNIAHYAYNPETGPATVRVEVTEDPIAVVITFIDRGVPYDPLKKEDPDITLSAEERAIGGLGIFMVKKTMDEISYEYKDGKNILRIKKNM